jgi:hypothetical protein
MHPYPPQPAPLSPFQTYTSWPGGIDPTVSVYKLPVIGGSRKRTRKGRKAHRKVHRKVSRKTHRKTHRKSQRKNHRKSRKNYRK